MYGKIFDTIFDSSIMEEDIEVRYVWHCMIVLADVDGNVDMTEQALARRINVHVSTVSTAVHRLSQPDPRSRSSAEQGRRLVPIDEHRSWGWHLVNRERYKDIRSPLDRRDYFREQKRRKRAEVKMSTCGRSGQCGLSTVSTKAEEEEEKGSTDTLSLPRNLEVVPPVAGQPGEKPNGEGKKKAGRRINPEVAWRVGRVWESHLTARRKLFLSQNGSAPREPTLVPAVAELIAKAIEEYDGALLGPEQREAWERESWARAAGIGIFMDPWMVGEDPQNDARDGGKKFLEPDRPWRKQRDKPDPVLRFGQLYFESRAVKEAAAQ